MSIRFWGRSHCGYFFSLTYFSKKSISSGKQTSILKLIGGIITTTTRAELDVGYETCFTVCNPTELLNP